MAAAYYTHFALATRLVIVQLCSPHLRMFAPANMLFDASEEHWFYFARVEKQRDALYSAVFLRLYDNWYRMTALAQKAENS